MKVYIAIKYYQSGVHPSILGVFATKELAEDCVEKCISKGVRVCDRTQGNYNVIEEMVEGKFQPELLSYDEITEIHKLYTLAGDISVYRQIEIKVLEKNGFAPLTIQFDWDYLDSLLTDEDRKELEEEQLKLLKQGGILK
nr:MAG: hypothetical protein [Caudoviricetes sp.]